MKFTIEKNDIFKSLSHVQSIVEKKNTLPILSNILLEAKQNNLILSATDMDISVTEKTNCNVIEEGSTTVSAHTLYDIIRKLQDSSEIEMISNDGKIMTLRSGKSKFSLGCLPKEDFPIIEIDNLENELKLNSQKLLKLIDKTR
jgi:DNA polymerase sliding clamp subunit (PCNA homolog)